MTDGPFKNPDLGSSWKRVYGAIRNEAASVPECAAVASDALTRHLVTREHLKALQMLDEHVSRGQLELNPLGSAEAIFNRCEKTPFLDAFEKELLFRTADQASLAGVITPALDAAIRNQISETQNRFQEECIRAREMAELTQDEHERIRQKTESTFDSIETERVRNALRAGDKDAFGKDLGIGDSVDEGMVCL